MSLVALALATSGCGGNEDYRWKVASVSASPAFETMGGTMETPTVNVYSFATPATASTPAPQGVGALSDHGQQAFITATAEQTKTAPSLDTLTKGKAGGPADPNSWNRTMVVTVNRAADNTPGDRLLETKVWVRPVNFLFSGYSVVATDTKTINIANLETDVDRSLSGELDPTLGPLKAGAFKGSLDKKTTSSTTINQGYENLDVTIKERGLSIYRQSERNLDLAGNALVALTVVRDPVETPAGPHWQVKDVVEVFLAGAATLTDDKTGQPKKAADATLAYNYMRYPLRCDLKAVVQFAYSWRHLYDPKDQRTYREGDDHVVIIKDLVSSTATVMPAHDVVPDLFEILSNGKPLMLETSLGQEAPLQFSDYSSAMLFSHWLTSQKPSAIGKLGDQLYVIKGQAISGPLTVGMVPYPDADTCKKASTQEVSVFNPALVRDAKADAGESTPPPAAATTAELSGARMIADIWTVPTGKTRSAPATAAATGQGQGQPAKPLDPTLANAARKLFDLDTVATPPGGN